MISRWAISAGSARGDVAVADLDLAWGEMALVGRVGASIYGAFFGG